MAPIRLPARLVFENVMQVLDDVSARIDWQFDTSIDLAGITHTDSAGLALLLELVRRGQSHGARVHYVNVPTALLNLARFFEVDRALGFSA